MGIKTIGSRAVPLVCIDADDSIAGGLDDVAGARGIVGYMSTLDISNLTFIEGETPCIFWAIQLDAAESKRVTKDALIACRKAGTLFDDEAKGNELFEQFAKNGLEKITNLHGNDFEFTKIGGAYKVPDHIWSMLPLAVWQDIGASVKRIADGICGPQTHEWTMPVQPEKPDGEMETEISK